MENLQTVQEIFSDKLFRVPDYQRGYAWEKRQWQDLIDDLIDLPEGKEHYTGTIVLNRDIDDGALREERGKQLRIFNIVDGQQRLTTILILLISISRELKEEGVRRALARGIREDYIQIADFEGRKHPRLRLNRDCHDYFQNNIISEAPTLQGPEIKSHELLWGARQFFREYLNAQKKDAEEYERFLLNLHNKITNGMKFTVYSVPDASDVGVIFEVMNNRGKPLSEMEKVKNYLLYLTSKIPLASVADVSNDINLAWGSIFEQLMEADASSVDNENQLLRSSWLMAHNYMPRDWKGYDTIKAEFSLKEYASDYGKLLEIVKSYVSMLRQACQAYCDILSPERDKAFNVFVEESQTRNLLRQKSIKLVRIGNLAPFLPLLMAMRIKYPRNSQTYLDALDICEVYAFRIYRFHERRSNTGQTYLFRKGNQLYNNKIAPGELFAKLKKKILDYSPDDRFIEKMKIGGMNWYEFYGLKYFLYEYEEHLSRGKGVQMPWDDLLKKDKQDTIEHILPQLPARAYWQEKWKPEQIHKYMHDIGNLTLTFDNSVYSNKPFPDKRGMPGLANCYTTSNLFQEKALASYQDWTEKELLERREDIVSWAAERWGISLSPEESIADDDEYSEEEVEEAGDIGEEESGKLKEWTEAEIIVYLDEMKERKGQWTYSYYKALALADKKLEYGEVLRKANEVAGGGFDAKKMGGLQAAITRTIDNEGIERLDDIESPREHYWLYSLNNKYADVIRSYFGLKN